MKKYGQSFGNAWSCFSQRLTLPPGRRYISGVVERFRNEIKTARKIRHKNVIDARGAGIHPDLPPI
jgi:peptide subunit release factor 1 (eRF1)